MKEKPFFPFRLGELLAESGNSKIWEDPDFPLVVKESKPDFPNVYETVEAAGDRIAQIRADLDAARERAGEWGLPVNSFTPVDFVIHASPNREITYSRVQQKIPNLTTLGQGKGAFLTYPSHTLRQLRGLFKMHSDMVFGEKTGFDLVGSTRIKLPLPIKGLRLMFPLITSENIGIDDEGNIHVIDYEVHRAKKKLSAKKKFGILIETAGATSSVVLLDAILLARKVLGKK